MKGRSSEVTVCGCGALNPLTRDPKLRTMGIGTRVLINGAVGYVAGLGTRATEEKPTLSGFADMFGMDPRYVGGFLTSDGPETINSWAVPIPILDEEIFRCASTSDSEIVLPVADVGDRIPFTTSDYGKVWNGTDRALRVKPENCPVTKGGEACGLKDGKCAAERICPTAAFSLDAEKGPVIDRDLCFNCGACVEVCDAVRMKMGSINVEGEEVPITLRQSNRLLAERLALELKVMMKKGEFLLSEPVAPLTFSEKDDLPCRFCDRSLCRKGTH